MVNAQDNEVMKEISEKCICSNPADESGLTLILIGLMGVCTSLLILCLYLFNQNRNLYRRISSTNSANDNSSSTDKCRINSFTWLELANTNNNAINTSNNKETVNLEQQQNKKFSLPKIYMEKLNSNTKCYQPSTLVGVGSESKLSVSVGMSNSISHSSYNSANEELEFDLYDYEHKRMLCDTSETDRDFSFSELAPKRLFDSKDTIINIADEVLDDVNFKPSQNTFGTPVVLRRGDFNSRKQIESITSDLTSSIMSELSLISKNSQETLKVPRKNRSNNVNSLIMCFDTESIQNDFSTIGENASLNGNLNSSFGHKVMTEKLTSNANDFKIENNKTFESHFNFPPLAQIEDIDISDDDSF